MNQKKPGLFLIFLTQQNYRNHTFFVYTPIELYFHDWICGTHMFDKKKKYGCHIFEVEDTDETCLQK